ncbi:hypothetical protein GCM10012285_43170 [Streptomyces kronopolitis]|uniref:Uncharacterized protein n=1 Tax=Streptomyces kronopolitis TaxID=1612435 RepID=A0ABQ2JNC2_9ACTN|nr:hypothetical protein GCM10012285_43170 [Streptomyces kronopolitis]
MPHLVEGDLFRADGDAEDRDDGQDGHRGDQPREAQGLPSPWWHRGRGGRCFGGTVNQHDS